MGAKFIEIDSNSENQEKVAQWATNCQRVKKAPRRGANWKANLKSTRRVENPKNQKDFIPILNGDRRYVLVIQTDLNWLQISSFNTCTFFPKISPKVSPTFFSTLSPEFPPKISLSYSLIRSLDAPKLEGDKSRRLEWPVLGFGLIRRGNDPFQEGNGLYYV